MVEDPDFRNINALTTGDFMGFELYDAGEWRRFHISGTALRILGGPGATNDMEAFERGVERIKAAALRSPRGGNGLVILNSDDFA